MHKVLSSSLSPGEGKRRGVYSGWRDGSVGEMLRIWFWIPRTQVKKLNMLACSWISGPVKTDRRILQVFWPAILAKLVSSGFNEGVILSQVITWRSNQGRYPTLTAASHMKTHICVRANRRTQVMGTLSLFQKHLAVPWPLFPWRWRGVTQCLMMR